MNKEFITNKMVGIILTLDKYDELEGTRLYRQGLKQKGNLYKKELIAVSEPLEKFLLETGEMQNLQPYIDMVEKVVSKMSNFNIEKMAMLLDFMTQLEEGKVIDVDPETYEKLKAESK